MRVMRASVVFVPTCLLAKSVPTSHFYVPTFQKRANVSTWLANIFQLRLPKGVPIFRLFFKIIFQSLNFSIMLNICKSRIFDQF